MHRPSWIGHIGKIPVELSADPTVRGGAPSSITIAFPSLL